MGENYALHNTFDKEVRIFPEAYASGISSVLCNAYYSHMLLILQILWKEDSIMYLFIYLWTFFVLFFHLLYLFYRVD